MIGNLAYFYCPYTADKMPICYSKTLVHEGCVNQLNFFYSLRNK